MGLLLLLLRIMFSHFALFLLLGINTITSATAINHTDELSLLAFKAKIEEDPFKVISSWNHSLQFCNWIGVTCTTRHPQRVVALNLSSYNLVGGLSPHLANLTFLRMIDLSVNNFRGEIPQELGRLSILEELDLSENSLKGEIPANLSNCKELKILWLDSNYLEGSIPHELGSLPQLRLLVLEVNSLTGHIPLSLGNVSFIQVLSFYYNHLTGSIPENLGQLKTLRIFYMGVNNLSGTLPPSFYNLSSLRDISLTINNLEGQLPPDMGLTLPNLNVFLAGLNQFSGPVATSFANASRLRGIDLGSNQLTGSIPMNLGNLKGLQILVFSGNKFTSAEGDHGLSFITSLTNCSVLRVLEVTDNNLIGALPATLANFSDKMESLNLAGNQISGSIPTGMDNLVGLNKLGLARNLLTGNIPDGICKLSNLQGITLRQNRLSGQIPSSLGNLTKLSILDLSNNLLEGSIPFSLRDCHQLEEFNLSENQLIGTIPGHVMTSPSVIHFSVSNNFIKGSLPLEIGGMRSLQTLDVSNNRLIGEIPSTLANCLDLKNLSMGRNFLQGSIPSTLTTLKYIGSMDLSQNNLSGKIPYYLEKFSSLRYLNLSYNDFEGEVPKQGVFGNPTAISVVGNRKLCGGIPKLHLQSCPKPTSKKSSMKASILLATLGSLSALFCCTLGLILYWRRRLRKKHVSKSTKKDSFLRVSYAQLLKATDGFSSDHLIGVGGYGSVYKGSLEHIEEVVAVKVLNLQLRGASRSFISECQVLRSIRHRNLIKLLTVCSSIDFNGNDFKALVFEYMPRGSLDKWLHQMEDEEHQSINLNFLQRLSTAIDVASALDYLHHHYDAPVVHHDLKPSNVLLDDDMVAHVSDFGLAKLLHEDTSNRSCNQTSTSGIKGTIGYVAPEYGMGTVASTLGDVYSYGVIVLEMFTGRTPTDNIFKDGFDLHQYAKMAWPDRVSEIADPRLLSEVESIGEPQNGHNITSKLQQCLISVMKIGIACSAESTSERMDMGAVVTEMQAVKNMYLSPCSSNRQKMTSLLEGPSYLSTY